MIDAIEASKRAYAKRRMLAEYGYECKCYKDVFSSPYFFEISW